MKQIHQKFTKKEIQYLIKNYSILGPKKCATNLKHKSWMYIVKKAKLLGVARRDTNQWKIDKSPKQIDISKFISITSPRIAYILGFIWADGYISKNKNRISIGIGKKDFTDINQSIYREIPFHIHFMKRNGNPVFYIDDIQLHAFLKENDYRVKSDVTPTKILSKISDNIKHYFFRGYFDGDGCFTKIKTCPMIMLTGSYNQDWKEMSNLIFKLTNHNSKILKRISKTKKGKIHKASMLYFYGKDRIKIFLDYLYQGEIIGLSRKRHRYEQFTSLLS